MVEKVKMTVTMDVTESQALSLQAMFRYWNQLSSLGCSRWVSFYVDGDGNFHPKCEVSFDKKIHELTDSLFAKSFFDENDGDYHFDFDQMAWALEELKNHD